MVVSGSFELKNPLGAWNDDKNIIKLSINNIHAYCIIFFSPNAMLYYHRINKIIDPAYEIDDTRQFIIVLRIGYYTNDTT